MNKTEYNEFVSAVQNMIFNFISEYDIPAACKLQQSNDDDIQWTLNLGKTFGSVNILIESWEQASYRGKVNVCFIPMKFHTYRDNEKLFLIHSGSVNSFNGRFILHTRSNAVETLLNDFKEVLEIWSYTAQKKKIEKPYVCMN